MCLAIYKPKGKLIEEHHLRNGFNGNPHGAGIAYNTSSGLVVEKGFFKFDDFIRAYKANQDRQMLIHFRWKTHGVENEFNCHPWKIELEGNEIAVIHNGVLSVQSSEEMSDTGHFVHHWLEPMLRKHSQTLWKDDVFKLIVEDFIGIGNKMVVMDSSGHHVIWNEKQGEWHDGVWFSNGGYKHSGAYSICGDDDDWWGYGGNGRYHRVYQSSCSGGMHKVSNDVTKANEQAALEAEAAAQAEHAEEIELYEDYLEEMLESDPSSHEIAKRRIEQLVGTGMTELEAMRETLC